MRTFEEIAEAQGWSNDTQLDLLRQYIANQGDEAGLSEFAEHVAAEENEFAEHAAAEENEAAGQ